MTTVHAYYHRPALQQHNNEVFQLQIKLNVQPQTRCRLNRSNTVHTMKLQKRLLFSVTRDSEWQWHQLGHMQVCTSLQTDNHASIPPLSFLQTGCPSCRPTNSVKALKALLFSVSVTLYRLNILGTVLLLVKQSVVCKYHQNSTQVFNSLL